MKIAGDYTVDAAPERIWPILFEPGALLEMLPGCDQIEQLAPNEFRGRLSLRVPALAGSYDTHVKIVEERRPAFCRLQGEALGQNGSVSGEAAFTLVAQNGGTRIEYTGDAQISGALAGLNSRFAEGVAQTLVRQGLARLPELIAGRAAAAAAATTLPFVVPAGPAPRWWRAAIAAVLAWVARVWPKVQSSRGQ